MRKTIIPLAVLAMACDGGTEPPPPPSYESIAGTYFGSTSGMSQGVSMQADFTVTITQSQGTLGGDYSLMGTLSDGVNVVSLVGGGALAGTIASGSNPSVNITATSAICSNVRTDFSGSYANANRVVTLKGTIPVFDMGTCQTILTYPNTVLILSR